MPRAYKSHNRKTYCLKKKEKMNLLKRRNCSVQNVHELFNFAVVQFDFENNKKLMMKIEMKIKREKEMETPKRETK